MQLTLLWIDGFWKCIRMNATKRKMSSVLLRFTRRCVLGSSSPSTGVDIYHHQSQLGSRPFPQHLCCKGHPAEMCPWQLNKCCISNTCWHPLLHLTFPFSPQWWPHVSLWPAVVIPFYPPWFLQRRYVSPCIFKAMLYPQTVHSCLSHAVTLLKWYWVIACMMSTWAVFLWPLLSFPLLSL